MQSAGAEKAVGKRLNIDWHASINTFHDGVADVGGRIEVRYRRKRKRPLDHQEEEEEESPDLIVREDDHEDRAYVLVRGALPKYEIVGWIWGRDAKRPEFWKNPGGHEPAFFVPEEHLRPVSELLVSRIRLGCAEEKEKPE
jgi:hypothetical protein